MTPRKLGKALGIVRQFNEEGIPCSLACLPVVHASALEVDREIRWHQTIIEQMARQRLDTDITIKVQSLGIYEDEALAREAALRIIETAARHGIFVWMDMELPATVDATIRIFREAWKTFPNTGICLQAYLRRTERDLSDLLTDGVPIRLVKGFYAEHDIRPWARVNANFERLMELVLERSGYPAIATHDLELIAGARKIIQNGGNRNAEFQFFRGVRDELARELAGAGFRVRIYVPFGNVFRFLLAGGATFDMRRQFRRMLGLRPAA